MRPVYSVRLVINADGTSDSEDQYREAVTLCHQWLQRIADRHNLEISPDPFETGRSPLGIMGQSVAIESLEIDDRKAWRAHAVHPLDVTAPDKIMRVEIQMRHEHVGETFVSIRLLVGSTIDSIRPVHFNLQPPKIMADLLEAFPGLVSSGNMRASDSISQPAEEDLYDLFHHLLRQDRLVPIIVISRDEEERVALNPSSLRYLARKVAGLARVFVLPSFNSAYKLTEFLGGKRLSCFRGAVRVYWPGLSVNDSSFDHPLYTKEMILGENLLQELPNRLFRIVAEGSALSISADSPELFQLAEQRKREAETRERLANLEEASRAAARKNDDVYNQYLDEAITEIKQHQSDLQACQWELGNLKQELVQERAYSETLRYRLSVASDPSDLLDHLSKALCCKSLHEAIELVQSVSSEDSLLFLPDAIESAKKHSRSYNGDYAPVLERLMRITKVAHRYHLGESDGDARGHRAMFEMVGESDYKANISDTARELYRRDYEKTYVVDGRSETIVLGPHLTYGSGNPASSVSIYWYVDTTRRRFVIGHVGRHLPGKRAT